MGEARSDVRRALSSDWKSLGLEGNPFENVLPGTHLGWVFLPEALERAVATRPFKVALLGPHKGMGKSTALHALAARFDDAVCVHAGTPVELSVMERFSVWLFDEADLAGRAQVAQWVSKAGTRSVVVASHQPVCPEGMTEVSLVEPLALEWLRARIAEKTVGPPTVDFVALASALAPRCSHVKYAVLRVLYELAESLARGASMNDATVNDAFARAAMDPTVAPLLSR